jgi:hypothetical protein
MICGSGDVRFTAAEMRDLRKGFFTFVSPKLGAQQDF